MYDLTIIIPTFNRPRILLHTVANLMLNLHGCTPCVLIGDDSDDAEVTTSMVFADAHFHDPPIHILPGPKRGLGANLNMLINIAKTDIIMQLDDDHHLVKPLDIGQYVADLMTDELLIGWIRLMLGEEKDVENVATYYHFQALNLGRYWYLDPDGKELYIPSNRPHLKRKDFHTKYYGFYDEDVKLGVVEERFCHRFKDAWHKEDALDLELPSVVIPIAAPPFGTWEHVGDSWQKRGY